MLICYRTLLVKKLKLESGIYLFIEYLKIFNSLMFVILYLDLRGFGK